MIFEGRLRPEAEQDLADVVGWYEESRQGLEHEFLDEILTMLSRIPDTPLMYPNVHRNTRRAIIQRFLFGIYYRVEDSTIVVVAVMHGSRNPRRWENRT